MASLVVILAGAPQANAANELSVEAVVQRRGWFQNDIRVVACNNSTKFAELIAHSKGQFDQRAEIVIPPQKCRSLVYRSYSARGIFEITNGAAARMISLVDTQPTLFPGESLINLVFLLVGITLAGLRHLAGQLVAVPVYLGRLYFTYWAMVRSLNQRQDDMHKSLQLHPALRSFVESPPIEAGWVPAAFANKVIRFVSVFDDWRQEKPVTANTRSAILELSGGLLGRKRKH